MYIRWFEKACFFLSIQSCCIFFLLKQWKCSNVSWVNLFWRNYFFFKLSLMQKGPLHRVCDCFSFISCHLRYDNTAFVHWCSLLSENTCFLSIYAVHSLVERLSLYISLWIFVSFVSELNCWIGSWHDYGWHWGGRIRGFIRWEI